jgi:hypothetical protein
MKRRKSSKSKLSDKTFGRFTSSFPNFKLWLSSRVARWHIFTPKILTQANFGGSWNGRCWPFGIFCGYLVYFVVTWYILWLFGILCGYLVYFVVIWYILWLFGIFYVIWCFPHLNSTLCSYSRSRSLFLPFQLERPPSLTISGSGLGIGRYSVTWLAKGDLDQKDREFKSHRGIR